MECLDFLDKLTWIDGTPLRHVLEPYRRRLFAQAFSREETSRFTYNLILTGRAKKNWKSADLVLAGLWALLDPSPGGNQCYLVGNDEDQAQEDLTLAKKLLDVNPGLKNKQHTLHLQVHDKEIRRYSGNGRLSGFLKVLPANAVAGEHGRTYRFIGFDEIHGYHNWDLLEALQLDPTRLDAQMFIASYASIYHKPGVPLFDLCQQGWAGADPRMLFSWYGADRTTDPEFLDAEPEARANPSRASWADRTYLEQQQRRLPAHKYRRLHLNLPGLPEGSAFQPDPIMEAIARGVTIRPRAEGVDYLAFVDMSGGSNDDAVLGIAHAAPDGTSVLDVLMNQGPPPPFDPRAAVARFATVLQAYGCHRVQGDKYAGETFVKDFERHGITYEPCPCTKSALYEAVEPLVNARSIVLLDVGLLEQQLLGLIWRGGKIDHLANEHDDWANAAVGAILLAATPPTEFDISGGGATLAATEVPTVARGDQEVDEAVLSDLRSGAWFQ